MAELCSRCAMRPPSSSSTTASRSARSTKPTSLNLSLRHEVARLMVWHVVTRPVVPSAVSYADVREGTAPYSACGHGTHSHPTGTCTVRERCLCQHQVVRATSPAAQAGRLPAVFRHENHGGKVFHSCGPHDQLASQNRPHG